jgi:hypothetical protein
MSPRNGGRFYGIEVNSIGLSEGFLMRDTVSRRGLLRFAGLLLLGSKASLAAGLKAPEFDDPFLGQTTLGDLVLAPSKTHPAALLPEKLQFFGIVRRTDVLRGGAGAGKLNMLVLYAAFRDSECGLILCNMASLENSTDPVARRAYDALVVLGQRVKARPDAIYDVQDTGKLPRLSCQRRFVAFDDRGMAVSPA